MYTIALYTYIHSYIPYCTLIHTLIYTLTHASTRLYIYVLYILINFSHTLTNLIPLYILLYTLIYVLYRSTNDLPIESILTLSIERRDDAYREIYDI